MKTGTLVLLKNHFGIYDYSIDDPTIKYFCFWTPTNKTELLHFFCPQSQLYFNLFSQKEIPTTLSWKDLSSLKHPLTLSFLKAFPYPSTLLTHTQTILRNCAKLYI